MPKIVQYNLPPGGTVTQLADNLTTALEIEGVDSKDYVVVKTVDGSESVTIKAGGAGTVINESGQMKSTASGGWMLISSDPTDTTPNIMPSMSDPNTGIGHYGGTSDSDALSLIAGGVEGIRLQETGGAVTTTITGAVEHSGALEVKGDLSVALTGLIASISGSTVTGNGSSSFLTELDIGAAIKWTNDAAGEELHTVTAIGTATSLTVDGSPGATTDVQAYTDPVLLQVNTGDDQTAFAVKPGGRIEVGDTSPANNFNTILGDSTAAATLTTGTRNAVFGRAAGAALTTGSHNVILGDGGGSFVTTGSYNTIIGREARGPAGGGSYNTMVGNDTGNNAVQNDHAVCLGVKAGMMGTRAISQAYGDQNVLLGNYTIPAAAGDANTIAIGYDCTGNGANTATIGNDSAISLHTPPVYSTSNATTAISGLIASISGTTVEGDGSANFTSDLKVGSSIRWLSDAVNISDFSEATPCSVTSSSHGRQTGDIVKFSSLGGVTGINGDYYWTITVSDANTFTLDDTTPSSFGGSGYTSGGTFQSRESHIVASITDADTLVVRTAPRGAATNQQAYTDPTLLKISSCAADILVVDKYGRVGINQSSPDIPLHVVGIGGSTGLAPPTGADTPTLYLDSGNADSANDRCTLLMNADGNSGSHLEMKQGDTTRLLLQAQGSTQTVKFSGHLDFNTTGGTRRASIDSSGNFAIGSAASLSSKEFEVNNGTQYINFDIQGGDDQYITTNGNRLNIGSTHRIALEMQKYGTSIFRGGWATATGGLTDDTTTTNAAYLADSGSDLVIDFKYGTVGKVTLTANIDKIKIYNCQLLGSAASMSVKIIQHASSAKTIDYSTVEFYTYSGTAGTTGSLNWAGAVPHTMSTGVGDVDIVTFTTFPETSAAVAITDATQANPCVITSNGHGLADGTRVTFASVVGMTELNGNTYTVANQTTNTFELSGTDSSGYTAYGSGGTFTYPMAEVYGAVVGQNFS